MASLCISSDMSAFLMTALLPTPDIFARRCQRSAEEGGRGATARAAKRTSWLGGGRGVTGLVQVVRGAGEAQL